MSTLKSVYIISGTLGAGKTTVSTQLSRKLKNSILIVGDTQLDPLLIEPSITWEEKLQLAWENITSITKSYLKRDLNVVIDFVVEDELEKFCREISAPDVEIRYIILTADEATITERLAERETPKDVMRSIFLLNKLTEDPKNNKYLFDTTNKPVSEVVQELLGLESHLVVMEEL